MDDFGSGVRHREAQLGGGLGHLGAGGAELDHLGAAFAAPGARQLLPLRHLAGLPLGMAAHVDPLGQAGPLQVRVAQRLPAAAQGYQIGLALGRRQGLPGVRPVAFPRPTALGVLRVVTLEILLGVALDAVALPLAEHQVRVGLLAAIGGLGVVDRPLVGVTVAQLLGDECPNQLDPLRGAQLARQGNFHLPVGRAVRPLVGISGPPELQRVGLCPQRQVAGLAGLQRLAFLQAMGVLAFSRDIGGMRPGLAGLAYPHAESRNRHVL